MNEIQSQLRRLTVSLVVVLVLLIGTIAYSAKSNYDLSKEGQKAHTAVCTLRDDLAQRISASEAYLATHPGDVFGIPRQQVLDGIKNQKATLKALNTAGCD